MGVFRPVRAYAPPTDRAALLRLPRTSVSDHVLDKKRLGNQIVSLNLRERLGNI
jgi:hypothetical protein